MPWIQLLIDSTRQQAEMIEDALLDFGAVSVTLQENIPEGEDEKPILEPGIGETPLWDQVCITGLFSADISTTTIGQQFKDVFPTNSFRWEQLEDKDWEREWMQNYQPIQCSQNLWICPSWKTPPDPSATTILLDPGLAFGTGTHPTTFLCLQWLASQPLTGKTLIDYGCGSGILGIAALKLGAKQVIGVDIDPQALLATQDNLNRNGLAREQFPVYLPDDVNQTMQVDIVLANILAGPLVELAPTLIDHIIPGGALCLSGILSSQQNTIERAYQAQLDLEPAGQREEWIRITGYKP